MNPWLKESHWSDRILSVTIANIKDANWELIQLSKSSLSQARYVRTSCHLWHHCNNPWTSLILDLTTMSGETLYPNYPKQCSQLKLQWFDSNECFWHVSDKINASELISICRNKNATLPYRSRHIHRLAELRFRRSNFFSKPGIIFTGTGSSKSGF